MAQVGMFSLVEVVEPDGHKHGKVLRKDLLLGFNSKTQ